ncbi:GtrA family protein [Candidatus Kaiserbacteria bacterium]|nr:GtrA family protein [Candidatus Kaiserbacteria bacterium]
MEESPKKQNYLRRLFWDKKFFHYTWIGIVVSLLNVILLWLFIDIMHWPTVFSSIFVVVLNFIIRYVAMDLLGVVG